jgi:SAM-dependent methyltransferase
MSHEEQRKFVSSVAVSTPRHFDGTSVLDIGSLDVNGNNIDFFTNVDYIGIDLQAGPNVDVVCWAHTYDTDKRFDVVISTECLEHDPHMEATIDNMVRLLKSGGLMIITAATTGRAVHGPGPLLNGKEFYKNVTIEDLYDCLKPDETFYDYHMESELSYIKGSRINDIRFWGVKI